MTTQTITLTLPERVYLTVQRAAEALRRPLEDVIVDTLSASLQPMGDVPAVMAGELAAMTHLSDEALKQLAVATMVEERQELLHDLLDEQGRGALDETGQRELAILMAEYGRQLLRRAKAVSLLLARGHSVPSPDALAE